MSDFSTFTTCREHANCVHEAGNGWVVHHPAIGGPELPERKPAPIEAVPEPKPPTHKHGRERHHHKGGFHPHVHGGDVAHAYKPRVWRKLRDLVMEA